ncbi:prepilin-type N-terminal cleavage/methylation domain-containing protein [Deinococcus detaillensis]|uniref:Prepilin-type N-terminal cleavage/methylation domain-containing protein n=1 Tax=Deinococcus detaillensis TaxID=2592048 RepID=A0A553V097_9DEIO|nr:prepilin-type N-terminal cleavage/methylation domain-containing protein [Deinococcus detaillensis]TSA85893.1 prepilin-type N-terminal cleavage/methylation domain-containing protein [Deinococcus detaillensis]
MKLLRDQHGFTLIELLISIFIAGALLVAIGAIINSSARDSNRINLNADIIKEGQIAQQIITGRLGEALYVWWPTGSATSNILLTTTGTTAKNTVNGNNKYQWTVASATAPVPNVFLAMVLPPRDPIYTPGTDTITNCSSNDSNSSSSYGCYRFFAYYPVLRSVLVNDSTLAVSSKPKDDPQNNDQWVLMEYRANLYDGSTAWFPSYTSGNGINRILTVPSDPYFTGRSGAILVDYIKPGSLKFSITRPTGAIAAGTVARPDGTVNFSFEMQRISGSDSPSIRATAANNEVLGATVSPRNWACPRVTSCP